MTNGNAETWCPTNPVRFGNSLRLRPQRGKWLAAVTKPYDCPQ